MLTERAREFGGRWSLARQREHGLRPGEVIHGPSGRWGKERTADQPEPPPACENNWSPLVGRAHGHAQADLKQIQAELSDLISRHRQVSQWETPPLPSLSARHREADTEETAPPRAKIGDNISAVVQGFTADAVIAVAPGPYGDEVIRLPVSLFLARPRLGSRVAVVVSVETESSPAQQMGSLESPEISALDHAYEALNTLLVQRHTHGPTAELEQRIHAAWAHLDELQDEACAEVRKRIDASFDLPPTELERLLAEVRAELAEDDE